MQCWNCFAVWGVSHCAPPNDGEATYLGVSNAQQQPAQFGRVEFGQLRFERGGGGVFGPEGGEDILLHVRFFGGDARAREGKRRGGTFGRHWGGGGDWCGSLDATDGAGGAHRASPKKLSTLVNKENKNGSPTRGSNPQPSD